MLIVFLPALLFESALATLTPSHPMAPHPHTPHGTPPSHTPWHPTLTRPMAPHPHTQVGLRDGRRHLLEPSPADRHHGLPRRRRRLAAHWRSHTARLPGESPPALGPSLSPALGHPSLTSPGNSLSLSPALSPLSHPPISSGMGLKAMLAPRYTHIPIHTHIHRYGASNHAGSSVPSSPPPTPSPSSPYSRTSALQRCSTL